MKMKIRIEHTSNPLNYGTNMMVTNFMYYLDKESGIKNKYFLDVTSNEDLQKYRNEYIEGNMEKHLIDYDFTYAKNIFQRISNKAKRDLYNNYATLNLINKRIKEIDKLIVLGGDDLSEYYSIKALKKEFFRISHIKKKKEVILVGQTIGPFHDERIELAKLCFENVNIYSRDPWTTRYLINDLKNKSTKDSADLAFLDLPLQDDLNIRDSVLDKYNLQKEKYVSIVPSGLYRSYCSDKDKYIENLVKIIKYICSKYSKFKVVILPHVLRNSDIDDRNIIKEIEILLGKDKNLVYIYDEMSPLHARFILGSGIFTVTGRMHGAISTLQMRKPAICISYSVKYRGVIGEGLGLNNLIVDGSNKESWKSNIIEKEVCKRIDMVENNYESLIKQIDTSVNIVEEKALNMIECIAKK